jgi:transposase
VIGWLRQLPGPLAVTYEAGPTGFGLSRALSEAGIACVVAAPSKLTRPAGDRVKTDARDALLLAQLLRVGQITAVRVPTVSQEAARDLVRARDDVRGDLMRARHRIRFDQPGTQAAYDAALEAVSFISARRDRLDAQIAVMAAESEFTATVRNLCCLRGVSTLTGFALAVEIGDWQRFTGASIGAYLGLVPSEHSSGQHRRQGAITRAGNSHVRRLLVEAAWHHKPRYTVGKVLQARWDQAPPAARARGHAGNQRLHQRWISYSLRKKKHNVTTTAIARELAGWCWSLATLPG